MRQEAAEGCHPDSKQADEHSKQALNLGLSPSVLVTTLHAQLRDTKHMLLLLPIPNT